MKKGFKNYITTERTPMSITMRWGTPIALIIVQKKSYDHLNLSTKAMKKWDSWKILKYRANHIRSKCRKKTFYSSIFTISVLNNNNTTAIYMEKNVNQPINLSPRINLLRHVQTLITLFNYNAYATSNHIYNFSLVYYGGALPVQVLYLHLLHY